MVLNKPKTGNNQINLLFQDPIKDYRLPIKLPEWFESIIVTRKREEISDLLISLCKKYNPDSLPLPDVSFPTLNGNIQFKNVFFFLNTHSK